MREKGFFMQLHLIKIFFKFYFVKLNFVFFSFSLFFFFSQKINHVQWMSEFLLVQLF